MDRQIKVNLTVNINLAPDQREYLIACRLADVGIPIDPMTQKLRYGELTVKGQEHIWKGKDWRQ